MGGHLDVVQQRALGDVHLLYLDVNGVSLGRPDVLDLLPLRVALEQDHKPLLRVERNDLDERLATI